MIIAIDGPAASGKGTLARKVAEKFGFDLLDTGLLYRAIGLKADYYGVISNEEKVVELVKTLTATDLLSEELRDDKAAISASKVAKIAEVRHKLLSYQRDFANNPPNGKGAILDGRDIGTVVCPGAELKLFVTASAEVRAKRRYEELVKRGLAVNYDNILKDLIKRDTEDKNRKEAPLSIADDAIVIDTSSMSREEVLAFVIKLVEARFSF